MTEQGFEARWSGSRVCGLNHLCQEDSEMVTPVPHLLVVTHLNNPLLLSMDGTYELIECGKEDRMLLLYLGYR